MPALALAFPLYQEGPCPVAMMSQPPGLAPAVCGTWSGVAGTQGGCSGEKETVTPWSRKLGDSWMGLLLLCGWGKEKVSAELWAGGFVVLFLE